MKKILVSGVAAAMFTLSMGAQATPFNYIDYTIGNIDYNNEGSDNGDYSAFTAVFETPIVPLVSLESLDLDNSDLLKLGIGAYTEIGSYTHLYGLVHFNDYDDEDSDFSLTAGLRSTLTDHLEFRASYSDYTDQDSLDGYKLSLGYYFTPNISVSGNYETFEFFDVISATARLNF